MHTWKKNLASLAIMACVLAAIPSHAAAWQGQDKPRPTLIPPLDPDGDNPPQGAVAVLNSMRLFHRDGVSSLAMSPDGTMVSCSALAHHPYIRVWSVQTGDELFRFPTPRYKYDPKTALELVVGHPVCHALAFSPDSAMLASGGPDATIIFWDVRKKR